MLHTHKTLGKRKINPPYENCYSYDVVSYPYLRYLFRQVYSIKWLSLVISIENRLVIIHHQRRHIHQHHNQ
jgi:hypothetical protein